MQINLKITFIPCDKCKGTGKTEKYEYTPPFEKYVSNCETCQGIGQKVESVEATK